MTILDYLDNQINSYYQRVGSYPKKIIVSPTCKKKLFSELELKMTLDNCWFDTKDNYRGIPISIAKENEIKLE